MKKGIAFILFAILLAVCSCKSDVYTLDDDHVSFKLNNGTLCVYPVADNAVRIKFYADTLNSLPELIFTEPIKVPSFKVVETDSAVNIQTCKLSVLFNKKTKTLCFIDSCGKMFLSETIDGRVLKPDSVMNESCYNVTQSFNVDREEHIFGLGQFQDGQFNLRNLSRRLTQVNSQIAIPYIYSDKQYAILWHQYGLTDFNPLDSLVHLELQIADNDENMQEVTTTAGTQKVSQNQNLYTGSFQILEKGEYSLFLDLGGMGNRHYVAIDDVPVIDQTNMWLPPTVGTLLTMDAGVHKVEVICKADNQPQLYCQQVKNTTTFRSPHAQIIDYTVFAGNADETVATYRKLSGNVPMLPLWAYGFWQCRERYVSSEHLIETVKEFRKRNLPVDVIVQDWQYWGSRGWGVPQFDETNYPNPEKFIKELHDLNVRFNVSIWSNPDKNSDLGKKYVENDRFIPDSKWLDYFNPQTRQEYWNTLKVNMFDNGVDSWWMDAVEPENDALTGLHTYAGLGDFYRLTYPLMVSKAVYEGQRSVSDDKRVCILTRSAFCGQQRYGIINWSGDIGGTWDVYKRQIVAGLNYTVTGFPFWTTDIGGFFRPADQYTNTDYQELFIRWFQWGVFNPIFRVHGYMSQTEPWRYGNTVEDNVRTMLNLRYSLLPYIYSQAWKISSQGYTLMRPLVMDFANDKRAVEQPYEFMFGQSFLISPITKPNVRSVEVYLPEGVNWYDFYTNERHVGGQTIETSALLSQIPVFVKSGSIIPFCKNAQYAKTVADTLEIRIYDGADAAFVLYEDEGDNYNYEKGEYSEIPFSWDDTAKCLTIGARKGEFKGMSEKRQFLISFVGSNRHSVVMEYTGKQITN